ncbi:MAG: hypothetical protein ABW328_15930 [Ilumatobacteraceae bacterium]
MSTATIQRPGPTETVETVEHVAEPVIALKRRTVDSVLIGFGVVATAAFAVAGGLLMWGHNFSSDYVGDELSSQNITFPSAEDLTADGRADLVQFADQRLDTGDEAEAYASFINGHLQGIAEGATYADLGAPESAAKADVTAAVEAGRSQAEIDTLQAKADVITNQRNSLFKGETLRGLLLSAYAWATVGMIAGIAAIGAFIAAGLMAILVVLGVVHHRRTPTTPSRRGRQNTRPAVGGPLLASWRP